VKEGEEGTTKKMKKETRKRITETTPKKLGGNCQKEGEREERRRSEEGKVLRGK